MKIGFPDFLIFFGCVDDKTTDGHGFNADLVLRNLISKMKWDKSMRGRFTKQQLYELRNRVPIRPLIEKELNIPNHLSGNVFRFECPMCRGYHTGIITKKNLARCFDCQANLNTIDMVIKVKDTEFYESASFLWELYKSIKMQSPRIPVPEPVQKVWPVRFEPDDAAELISIGSIMENFGFPPAGGNKESPSRCRKMKARIEMLEKDAVRLKNQVDKLERFVAATSVVKYKRKKLSI